MFLLKEKKKIKSKNFIIYFNIFYKLKILFSLKNKFFQKKINKKKLKKIFLFFFKKNKFFFFLKIKILKNFNNLNKIKGNFNFIFEIFFIFKKISYIIF